MPSRCRRRRPKRRKPAALPAADIDVDARLACNESVGRGDESSSLDEQMLIGLLKRSSLPDDVSQHDIRIVDVQIELEKCAISCVNENDELVRGRPEEADDESACRHLTVTYSKNDGSHRQSISLVDCDGVSGETGGLDDDSSCVEDDISVIAGDHKVESNYYRFVCDCGNEEADCFRLMDVVSTSQQTYAAAVATCLVCDRVVRVPDAQHVGFDECWSCGRSRADGLVSELYDQNGDLVYLRCLVCDVELQLPRHSFASSTGPSSTSAAPLEFDVDRCCGVECRQCGNCDAELIEDVNDDVDGTPVLLRCLVCETQLELPPADFFVKSRASSSSSSSREAGVARTDPRRQRIRNMYELRRGDQVALHKSYVVWHHAIVDSVRPENEHRGKLNVVHNSGEANEVVKFILPSVRLEELDVDLTDEELYRYDYSDVVGGLRYTADEIVRRAKSRLGETYHPFTFNCEHFARWCVTGNQKSDQVWTFAERVGTVGGCTVAKAAQEAIATGVEIAESGASKIFPSCLRYVELRSAAMFEAVGEAARNVKVGAIVGNVVVNLVAEAILFGVDAWKSYRRYLSGEISNDDFRQQLSKAGMESACGFIGSTGWGIVGQLLVPVPFVGGLFGCTVGGLLGRFFGAMIGKRIGKN